MHGVTVKLQLQYSKVLKLPKMFFWGEILFWSFWAKRKQNGPKVYMKNLQSIFSDFFLHKITVAYKHIIDLNDFFRKNLFWDFLAKRCPKWAQNRFFKYYSKSLRETFHVFYMKLWQHKEFKLMEIISWITFFWGF